MDNEAKLRPLYIATILYEQTDEEHYLTTTQLMNTLETKYGIKSHRLTIKSDIELLQQFGMEIQEVKSTQNRYNVYGRKFDLPELKLLIDAVESSKFITQRKSKELVSKLASLTSEHMAGSIKRNVTCENRIKPDNEKIYLIVDVINQAINENKQISFPYFNYNEKKEKQLRNNGEPYVLTPLHLVWNGDYYYLVGVYDSEQCPVNFRVDRILKCPEILDAAGTPAPEGFDINEYINTTFRMYNCEHDDVELICDNSVMGAIIDRFGEGVTTYENNENTFTAVVNVATSHIFYSWVFGFNGKVKIKAPDDVREKYLDMLKSALESEA